MSDDDAVDVEVEAPNDESGAAGDAASAAGAAAEEPADANGAAEEDAAAGDAASETPLADRVAAHDEELAAAVADLEAGVTELEAELAEAEETVEDLEGRLKRSKADFQNYKQRQQRKQEQIKERAAEDLVERIVPVRDNLIRALDQEEGADIRPGVESTLEEFDRVLEEEGVEPIEPEPGAEVDPTRHQVMLRVESDQPEGTVHEVYQPGYELGEKVIREAQVTVSDGDD
ncbi:nucleotide exchange factor GrpE [Haloparvum sedimenti]|uniref:nucleotide exchange factor GrpE n=1 Tax=Haloparvum sedimenti TaxID=1678448 RepID=UPI00071E99D5|nr:nucleotide exchange factor GrpE [Haloparvum sedimenti]